MPTPGYAYHYCQKAIDYADQKNIEKAAAYYQKALYHDPMHHEANYRLGAIYAEQGSKKKSLKLFKKLVDSHANPRYYITAYTDVGINFFHQGNYRKTIEVFNKADLIDNLSYETRYYLGHAHLLEGNRKEAEAQLHKIARHFYSLAVLMKEPWYKKLKKILEIEK